MVLVVLKVVASERVEALVAELASALREQPADPFTPDWIAVGSEGLQRWLQLELARHLGATPGDDDGVAANIIFQRPGSLRTAALLSGTSQPEYDPWMVNRLTWAVLETLHECGPSDQRLAPLVDSTSRSIYRRARQIAQRFSTYHLYRPEMIRAWNAGRDTDANGDALSDAQAWQAHLWRLLRAYVAVPSTAERLVPALEAIRDDAVELVMDDVVLPPRLIFFGPSLLPTGAGFLEVADAVAQHRDVLVYVIEPSAPLSLSMRSTSMRSTARPITGQFDRAHDLTAEAAIHPLLRSWGRLQRETALLLADVPVVVVDPGDGHVGHGREDRARHGPGLPAGSGTTSGTLLHAIQSDIHANRAPAGAFILDPTDRSITMHRCYGPTRQVEALKDVLLGLLADGDLNLVEDDIVVACPALDVFAPLVRAVFGPSATADSTYSPDGSPLLRYRITGQSGSTDNAVIEGLRAMLRVAAGRFDVDEVVDFLYLPAVRARFKWSDDDLDRISGWIDDTNIRWGIDAAHRSIFGLPVDVSAFTWRHALDQLIIGTAVRADDGYSMDGTIPIGLAAGDPELIGQLASVIDALAGLAANRDLTHPVETWVEIIKGAQALLVAPAPDSGWQSEAAQRHLTRMTETSRIHRGDGPQHTSGPPPSTAPLSYREVTELLDDIVSEQRGRSDFFRGGITVTSFNALRNVPSRVLAILGADQAAFSSAGADSDDLIAIRPRIGDRDPRAEVRQTLLDALLATSDRFIVLSDGTDVRTNTAIPPAVVISELIDTIDATCTPAVPEDGAGSTKPRSPGTSAAVSLTTVHPRQPFDYSYFDRDASATRSYDQSALAAARARRERSPAAASPDWLHTVLNNPVADKSDRIDIADIKGVLTRATKTFLSDGLGIRLPDEVDVRTPELPIEGDGLTDWQLGSDVLGLLAQGRPIDEWTSRQVELGTLPPLGLADRSVTTILAEARRIHSAAADAGSGTGPVSTVVVDDELGDGRRLTGRVDVTATHRGPLVSLVTYSRPNNEQLLRIWVDMLAVGMVDDSPSIHGLIVTRYKDKRSAATGSHPPVTRLHTGPLGAGRAREVLTELAGMYDLAIRRPVPLFPKVFGPDPDAEPRDADWASKGNPIRPEVAYVYGNISLSDLRALTAGGHPIATDGDALAEAYAHHVWDLFATTVTVGADSDDAVSGGRS